MSTVRIKRSQNTHVPASLQSGELSYTANGDLLYIGRPDGSNTVTAIGGRRYPGVLTANQSLVANSTLGINEIRAANIHALGGIYANSSLGTDGQVLTSNGTVAYWSSIAPGGVTSVTGANGLITTGTTSVTLEVGAGNGISTNADHVAVVAGSGIASNSTGVHVVAGNSQLVSNATGVWVIQGQIDHNSLSNYVANRHIDHTAVAISAGNGLTGGGNIDASRTLTVLANNGLSTNSTGVFVVAGVGHVVNSTGVHVLVGNSQLIANATGLWVNQGQIDHNSLLNYSANRHTDHTAVSIATANGIAGGGDITATRNLYVVANNGLLSNSTGVFAVAGVGQVVNSTGIHTLANNGIIANTTGCFVNAGNGLVANATGVHVGAANGISVGTDDIRVLGGSTLTVNATGVHVNSTLTIQDLTLSGNLVVTGTLVSVDTTNMAVNDSIIELARNNAANALDIGFYGQYNDGSNRYTGLIWDTSSGQFELFSNTTVEPTTTLDTGGVGYVRQTLNSYLKSGWGTGTFVANATGVTITANSTYAVAITANSASFSTAVPATSGGTGWGTFTAGDMLYASNTSYLSKLALGADGAILQVSGTTLLWDTAVDGGTF